MLCCLVLLLPGSGFAGYRNQNSGLYFEPSDKTRAEKIKGLNEEELSNILNKSETRMTGCTTASIGMVRIQENKEFSILSSSNRT